ncbi:MULTISPECIES: flagellar export protein FliJ [Pseudomonas]|jgi:flagellar export protein FliJ|uniref:flagellar export protein FliJ n=1 Tax=Pseudomonas TaxID=286 RepID=UPI000BA23F71|nr:MULTISPECIES: flagellar export protein FliJ [Pseudomonas]AOA04969.1 flagellar export protein FliJ [Pseudomonas sp. TMW 2.1634]PAA02676.1 flagellar export protein FliJ [Pseudomonas fragi]PAA27243.1 flagellar export protein FliJ [Pseudomonas fragi]
MKERINVLNRLAQLRAVQARQIMGRVTYQQNLCERYRNNIAGLTRLCGFTTATTTPLQRHNQQQYKATLHAMTNLQVRELKLAEQTLKRIQDELQQVVRQEKVLAQVIEDRMRQWLATLAQQEQKIQDGLASQTWWRNKARDVFG